MLNCFSDIKNKPEEDEYLVAYNLVEKYLNDSRQTNFNQELLRKWFVYRMRAVYGAREVSKMNTSHGYVYKIFKTIRDRYNINTKELALKIDEWWSKYDRLGYNGGDFLFSFQTLTQGWILSNLEKDIPRYKQTKNISYQNKNINSINTSDRRRK